MSPFKSAKQRRYLYKNKPKMAKKWAKRYGTKPKGKKKSKGKGRRRKKK